MLDIQDNGAGIRTEVLEAKGQERGGLGLLSMEERALLSGGVFTISFGNLGKAPPLKCPGLPRSETNLRGWRPLTSAFAS